MGRSHRVPAFGFGGVVPLGLGWSNMGPPRGELVSPGVWGAPGWVARSRRTAATPQPFAARSARAAFSPRSRRRAGSGATLAVKASVRKEDSSLPSTSEDLSQSVVLATAIFVSS